MNADNAHHGTHTAHSHIRERCGALGMPTWRCSAGGEVTASPAEIGAAGAWLRSDVIVRLVRDAAAFWAGCPQPRPRPLFDGCEVVPLAERHRRRTVGFTIAMSLAPRALDHPVFEQACRSAGIRPDEARAELAAIAAGPERVLGRLQACLGWMHDDLTGLHEAEQTIDVFSSQLTDSYEEVSLLYKLRQYMNELAQPHRFVRQACAELSNILPYRWIGARFIDDRRLSASLSGRSFVTGDLPAERPDFAEFADARLARLHASDPFVVPEAESGALADASGVIVAPVARDGVVVGAIFVGGKQGDDREVTSIELKMLEAAAGQVSILLENACLYESQHAMFLGTLQALSAAIDAKDPYTCGHSERVAHLAAELARVRGMPDAQIERVRIAGLVHDIGKIGVPEEVLRKPGRLTDAEFDAIKKHPEIGHHILHDIPLLDDVLPGVLHHHERFDGRGYPAGIAGDDIPLIPRIVGLVDAFDAMSSNRTYRKAMPRAKVLSEIRAGAGTQFDPELAEAFMRVDLSGYDALVRRHKAIAESDDHLSGAAA